MTRSRAKVTVAELMLRPDVHGRRRPEDLEVLELAYRMRRRIGPEPVPERRFRISPLQVAALVGGLLALSGVVLLVTV